jgi:2'-5' RNA ligase
MQNIAKIQAKLLPYSIGVYFDAESEAKIRALWKKLAEKNLADYLHNTESRPHLTLAIYEDLELFKAHEILTAISENHAPIPLSFEYVGVFPTTRGTFLGPVVTESLLELHRQVNGNINPHAKLPEIPYYLPEQWVPHCGVAIEVETKNIPEIIQTTSEMFEFPFNATVIEIGITTHEAGNEYCCYQLGKNQEYN